MARRTIELLEKLRSLGFSNAEFRVLHHQSWASIGSMIRYCQRIDAFRSNDNNARVRERLQYVLASVERQNLRAPIDPAVFFSLAEESVRRIPFDGVIPPAAAAMPVDQEERLDDRAEKELLQRTDIGPTEIECLSKARRGQDLFRDNVCRIEKACRVTGVTDPSLLIASHIKPWRNSTDAEKLDGYNGLMLAPHVDRLFDKGYISFEDDGELLVARMLDPQVLSAWGLQVPLNVDEFHARHRDYLAYHRSVIFLDRTENASVEA